MKRLGMVIAVGALILLGSALPALAQTSGFSTGDTPGTRQPAYNVSFNGQMRFIGVAWDNLNDFTDTDKKLADGSTPGCGRCKDSQARYFERLRWWLTIESADKKAKIVWNAQVGDLTLGNGGGVADSCGGGGACSGVGSALPNVSGRVGTNAGGAEGARGVNMQQRQIYIAFEPWIPNTQVVLGIQYVQFLDGPSAEFFATNTGGVRFDATIAPVDLQVYGIKLSENNINAADDNDFYAARIGVNLTKDLRLTVEGLVGNFQCFQRRPLQAGQSAASTNLTNTGSCVKADFADARWAGATLNANVANMKLYGAFVYGRRPLYSCTNPTAALGSSGCLNKVIKEEGYGFQATAQVPVGPLGLTVHGWYTSGDKQRIAGDGPSVAGPDCTSRNVVFTRATGQAADCSLEANTTRLSQNSDKLPVPEGGSSWLSMPYIADFLTGNATIGGPTGLGQPFNADVSGTWGVGAAVSFALTPAFNLNGGVGFMRASETKNILGGKNAIFGDHAIELDFGPRWTINTNLSMQGILGYIIPDTGDSSWAAVYRFIYFF